MKGLSGHQRVLDIIASEIKFKIGGHSSIFYKQTTIKRILLKS